VAEFAVLREARANNTKRIDLEVHPHLPEPPKFTVEGFLSKSDFRYLKESTGRINTFSFDSYKTRAVGAARKALPMGTGCDRHRRGTFGPAHTQLDVASSCGIWKLRAVGNGR
jgi:hypothetical protein